MIHLFLCVTCLFVCLFVSLCIVLFRHSSVYDIGSLFSTRTGSKHEVYIVLYCIDFCYHLSTVTYVRFVSYS